MGTSILMLLMLVALPWVAIGFQDEIISHVNFGAFLTPQGEIVNSGSTWIHTFEIDELLGDPIPPGIRTPWRPSMMGCTEITRASMEGIQSQSMNVTLGDVQKTGYDHL